MRAILLLLALTVACQTTTSPGEAERSALEPPALDRVVRIYDQTSGRVVGMDAMLDDLATREVVFFGETHLDETTHRLELAVYQGLIERTGGKVVLAMEMFERDVQPALDAYLAGEMDEGEFLKRARPWNNYRSAFRPLIETARRRGLVVVASNAPAQLRRKVAAGGAEAFAEAPPGLLPPKLYPNPESYWKRFERVVRGHMGMVAGSTPEERLYSTQSVWDNTMGFSTVQALARYPGHVVLHINGGFHSQYRSGAVYQLLQRRPATRVAVIEAAPTTDLPGVSGWRDLERADYLMAVDARARGPSEGFLAVTARPELRYRLYVPHGKKKLPLLVWLPDEGFRARDGLAFWRTALGEEAAIAVVEPPYPQIEADLSQGGRWFWPETFSEDLGTLEAALGRVFGYVTRHYPVDPDRAVLAGTGSGATVVAATALYASGLKMPAIAAAPQRYAGLRRLALPGEASGTLTVLPRAQDRAWWDEEADAHGKVGLETVVAPGPASLAGAENAVRRALALDPKPEAEGTGRVLLLLRETPRARFWAELLARRVERRDGRRVAVVEAGKLETFLGSERGAGAWELQPLACLGEPVELPELPGRVTLLEPFGPADMEKGLGLPLAAGPFGGTTILLLPEACPEEQRAAWKALAEQKVLSKRTRFARLEVVTPDGLAAALQAVKDAGRSTVLVVPALFCADGERMRRWAREAQELAGSLNLSWLPGLGGEVHALR